MHKGKKILIIVIPLFLIIIVCAIVLFLLYINTDFLKSDETLFLKYISQNADALKAVIDNTSEKEFTNVLRQNKYESTSNLVATYTENVNTSQENTKNDINKIKITTETQSDYPNEYLYKNTKIMYNDSSLFTNEFIHEGQKYGIRFPQKFSQFLAVENHDVKKTLTDAGIEELIVAIIPENLEEFDLKNLITFTDEEIATMKANYLAVFSDNISKDKFSKQKDALITIGKNSIYTNAYSVTITQEQANNLYIKMLEQLKTDEIILNKISQLEPYFTAYDFIKRGNREANNDNIKRFYQDKIQEKIDEISRNNIGADEVKYTVYEANGITARTQILEKTTQIIIDFNKADDGIELNIKSENANEQAENKDNVQIVKKYSNGESKFLINLEKIVGEVTSKIELYRNINIQSSNPKAELGLTYDDGNNNILEAKFDEDIKLEQEISKNVETTEQNTVILNNYEAERTSAWTNQMKDYLNSVIQENQQIINNLRQVNWLR